jgi:hypothetical protein
MDTHTHMHKETDQYDLKLTTTRSQFLFASGIHSIRLQGSIHDGLREKKTKDDD